jgi:NDP-sugar pyrophosphorylase family protein
MKTLLILPGDRTGVEALSDTGPLATLSLFGTSFVGHWLSHLAHIGAKHVRVLASDRADHVRAEVGDGSRWGIEVEVIRELRELSVLETCRRYDVRGQEDWLAAPNDVIKADHLPQLPNDKLFESYEKFFASMQTALVSGVAKKRVGAKEIKPGIWAGLRTTISPGAVLEAPCWLGEGVHIERDAHVGPNSILEDRTWVGAGAEVKGSYLSPDTHLGVATSLNDSLALGSLLVDWKGSSTVRVLDSYLLCCLRTTPLRDRMNRMAARIAEVVTPEPRVFAPKSFGWRGPALR